MASDLVAFLKARLDEDEDIARYCQQLSWSKAVMAIDDPDGRLRLFLSRHDPAQMLREVAAKRAIVRRYKRFRDGKNGTGSRVDRFAAPIVTAAMLPVIEDMATVYSGHPDYDPAWAIRQPSGL